APDVISHLPELRLVLLGRAGAGKSTAGNTILGREEFQTDRITTLSTKSEGVVAGRQITLVDTPGWDGTLRLDTPKKVKQEIELSASLCFLGPHALLLVIPLDSPTEKAAAKELSEIFYQNAWWHTMLLFTCKESLEGRTIEELIESAGEELHQLLKKCGDRYHVLCTKNRTNPMQIEKLLEKSEKLATENNGVYIKNEILTEQGEKEKHERRRNPKTRSEVDSPEVERPQKQKPREEELVMKEGNRNRQVMNLNLPNPKDKVELGKEPEGKPNSDSTPKALVQPNGFRSHIICFQDKYAYLWEVPQLISTAPNKNGDLEASDLPGLRLVLLGLTGSGKSGVGNTILGQEEFTTSSSAGKKECEIRKGQVFGRQVAVINMPDWFSTEFSLDEIQSQIESYVSLSEPGSYALLLVVPLDQPVGNGRRTGDAIQEVFGEQSVRFTLVLFTHGDVLKEKMSERMLECKDREVTTLQRAGQERETNQRERQDSLQTQDTERTHAVKKSSKLINTYQ
uniref:GTPase IMAP family member 8 n=1 Tax=Lepisosteus oculatus TaxID=7918 RepID=W5M507_LEPOC